MTFNLSVKEIIEHEDGSATVTFDMDASVLQALIQYAMLDILTKGIEKTKEYQDEVLP